MLDFFLGGEGNGQKEERKEKQEFYFKLEGYLMRAF